MKKDVAASATGADKNEIVVYQPEGGEFHIEVRVENESVWLNRQQMAILFGRDVKTIGKHIANALKEELKDIPTVANFATVQNEGGRDVRRNVEHYNLDVIISVGYRVKSANGVKFRQWANQVLRDHLLKGYSINQRMLAMGGTEIALFKQNVDIRLSAVEQRVDFFVNTAHSAQNQRIEQLSNDVQKVMANLVDPNTFKHFLILNGQRLEADVAYTQIYGMAKKSVLIVDNYLDVKTLDLLRCVAKGVSVKIFSEQHGRTHLTESMLADFRAARPDVELSDVRATGNMFHDRYIYLDFGTDSEKLFHCGASCTKYEDREQRLCLHRHCRGQVFWLVEQKCRQQDHNHHAAGRYCGVSYTVRKVVARGGNRRYKLIPHVRTQPIPRFSPQC